MPRGSFFALIGDVTGWEFMIICIVGLVVLGPERLPDMARQAGQLMAKARRQFRGMSADMREVLDDPSMEPLKEFGRFAAQPRRTLAEYARSIDEDADSFWEPKTSTDSDPVPTDVEPWARPVSESGSADAASVGDDAPSAERESDHP